LSITIFYETHALTEDNEAGNATGWLPGRLSAAGRGFARALGERYAAADIAAVFVSDLARAVETAAIAFPDTLLPVHRDARLRECNYGTLNGMPVTQLAAVRAQHLDEPFPAGESYREVVARTRGFLRELAAAWDGRSVLLISHSANKWALDCLLNGADLAALIEAPFGWQEGWRYVLPAGWAGAERVTTGASPT